MGTLLKKGSNLFSRDHDNTRKQCKDKRYFPIFTHKTTTFFNTIHFTAKNDDKHIDSSDKSNSSYGRPNIYTAIFRAILTIWIFTLTFTAQNKTNAQHLEKDIPGRHPHYGFWLARLSSGTHQRPHLTAGTRLPARGHQPRRG